MEKLWVFSRVMPLADLRSSHPSRLCPSNAHLTNVFFPGTGFAMALSYQRISKEEYLKAKATPQPKMTSRDLMPELIRLIHECREGTEDKLEEFMKENEDR